MFIVSKEMRIGSDSEATFSLIRSENTVKVFFSIESAKRYLFNTVSRNIVWDGNVGEVTLNTESEYSEEHVIFTIQELEDNI